MSYSVEATRRRLPWLYLAVPAAALVIWLLPHAELLGGSLWFLLPLWVALGHLLVGASYALTSLSLRRGRSLLATSRRVYGPMGSLTHAQAALLISLAEEIVLRYALLFELAERLGPVASLVITSTLFSLAHYRFGYRLASLPKYLDMFLFGMVLGALVLVTESFWPALIVHATRNYVLRCVLISREEYEQLQRTER